MNAQCAYIAQQSRYMCADYAHDFPVRRMHKGRMDIDWFKARKEELGFKDAALAAVLGKDRSVVNRFLNGKVGIDRHQIDALAEFFQVSRDELMFRAGMTASPDPVIEPPAAPVMIPMAVAFPNEDAIVAVMRGLLRGVGLEEEADKYAETLAQRLPKALARASEQLIVRPSDSATTLVEPSQPVAKRDPDHLQ